MPSATAYHLLVQGSTMILLLTCPHGDSKAQVFHVQLFIITILLNQFRRAFCLQTDRQGFPSASISVGISAWHPGVHSRSMSTSIFAKSASTPLMVTCLSIPGPEGSTGVGLHGHPVSWIIPIPTQLALGGMLIGRTWLFGDTANTLACHVPEAGVVQVKQSPCSPPRIWKWNHNLCLGPKVSCRTLMSYSSPLSDARAKPMLPPSKSQLKVSLPDEAAVLPAGAALHIHDLIS